MTMSDLSAPARQRYPRFRTPGLGESLVLDTNEFAAAAFTGGVLSPLAPADLEPYLAPYPDPRSRRPLLAWTRALPLDGEPADVTARVEHFDAWLAATPQVPKLLLTFDGSPTLLIDDRMAAWCAAHLASLETVACGRAGHHAPEDQPAAIAAAIAAWMDRHGLVSPA
jgi:haloalkane dehalogenase